MGVTDNQRTEGENSVEGETLDALHWALADPTRRYLIAELAERDEGVAVADLARSVAAREDDVPPEEVSDEAIDDAYLSLYHKQIPMLADAEIVEYDRDRSTIRKGPSFSKASALRRRYSQCGPS